jgi:DNA-binding response OmpR family regulator
MKVLIADDDRSFVELVSTRLRARGHQVLAALDAIQAFANAVRNVPDAIILDLNMPGGTGVEALKKIKNSTKTSGIPVIIASGLTDRKQVETVLALGAEVYLPKPVKFEILADALTRLTGVKVE